MLRKLGKDPLADLQQDIQAATTAGHVPDTDLPIEMERRPRGDERRLPGQFGPATGQTATHACPYVGLFQDSSTRFLNPNAAHYCFTRRRPQPIPIEHQKEFCLSGAYTSCEIYVEAHDTPHPDKPRGFLGRLLHRGE